MTDSQIRLSRSALFPVVLRLLALTPLWASWYVMLRMDLGRGTYRAILLVGFLSTVPILLKFIGTQKPHAEDRWLDFALATIAGLLVVAQLVFAVNSLNREPLNDIGETTLAAVDAVVHGQNPYVLALDPAAGGLADAATFAGYKYPPLMIGTYLPLGTIFGRNGMILTNLLLELSVAWLACLLALRHGSRTAGLTAAIAYLAFPGVASQLYVVGVTDLAAIVPLLGVFLCIERRPWSAGFLSGVSMAVKLLPGLIIIPCCLPKDGRHLRAYSLGLMLGAGTMAPFFAWAPRAFWNNIIVFNFLRPIDSTSWMFNVFPLAASIAHGVLLCSILAVFFYLWWINPGIWTRLGCFVGLTLLTMLAGPGAHLNYQLWWLPAFAAMYSLAIDKLLRDARFDFARKIGRRDSAALFTARDDEFSDR